MGLDLADALQRSKDCFLFISLAVAILPTSLSQLWAATAAVAVAAAAAAGVFSLTSSSIRSLGGAAQLSAYLVP